MAGPLSVLETWPVPRASAAMILGDGTLADTYGPLDQPFRLASVTKVLVAMAAWVAVEEGSLDLDAPAGPPGATVRHLLAHASGLAPDADEVLARPRTRRIYSNRGFEVLGAALAAATGIELWTYVEEAVVAPLHLDHVELCGSAASGASASVSDLAKVAADLMTPTVVSTDTVWMASSVAFEGLDGVLPGFGKQSPNDWGLGVEVRGRKSPHWTGARNSPRTFGHFGRAGTFLWVDPDASLALVCLTDTPFGPWAAEAWPALSDAVVAAASR
jgi:CubicO group peptidase (beta-lactamase class C family)